MEEHVLITLTAGGNLEVARTTTFDLDTAASLLLDVLHVGSAMTDHLSPQVKARERLKFYRDFFLGPFSLFQLVWCMVQRRFKRL